LQQVLSCSDSFVIITLHIYLEVFEDLVVFWPGTNNYFYENPGTTHILQNYTKPTRTVHKNFASNWAKVTWNVLLIEFNPWCLLLLINVGKTKQTKSHNFSTVYLAHTLMCKWNFKVIGWVMSKLLRTELFDIGSKFVLKCHMKI
jgi:hypothetical protein